MGTLFGGGPSNSDIERQQEKERLRERERLERESERITRRSSISQLQDSSATTIRLGSDQDVDGAGVRFGGTEQRSIDPTGIFEALSQNRNQSQVATADQIVSEDQSNRNSIHTDGEAVESAITDALGPVQADVAAADPRQRADLQGQIMTELDIQRERDIQAGTATGVNGLKDALINQGNTGLNISTQDDQTPLETAIGNVLGDTRPTTFQGREIPEGFEVVGGGDVATSLRRIRSARNIPVDDAVF